MNYGDLASIVQLGVGLHLGTAVLQIYGELGVAPFERRIARIRSLIRPEATATELEAELSQLEGRYELFKIEFFNQYRFYISISIVFIWWSTQLSPLRWPYSSSSLPLKPLM